MLIAQTVFVLKVFHQSLKIGGHCLHVFAVLLGGGFCRVWSATTVSAKEDHLQPRHSCLDGGHKTAT